MDPEAKRRVDGWGLAGPTLVAESALARVYRVEHEGRPAALKVFTELGVRDESAGTELLARLDGRGAVRLLRHDEGAQLLEWVEGASLLSLVKKNRDGDATKILCEVLERLHAAAKPSPRLVPLETRFRSLLEYRGADPVLRDGRAVAHELLRTQENETALHGDLHHENVLLHPERGWIAIDPKGLRGERAFDAANLLYNPVGMPELVANPDRVERHLTLIAERLGLHRARFRLWAFAYGALSALWSEEDGQPQTLARKVLDSLGRGSS